MRGKGADFRNSYSDRRITPACAGKSQAIYDITYIEQDHPRLCGEKS